VVTYVRRFSLLGSGYCSVVLTYCIRYSASDVSLSTVRPYSDKGWSCFPKLAAVNCVLINVCVIALERPLRIFLSLYIYTVELGYNVIKGT
jgi:hypothetical protein